LFLTTARVRKKETVARNCFTLSLKEEKIASHCTPGQFVHVRLSMGYDPFLRRPFSVAAADPAEGVFRLLIQTVGEGTRLLQGIQEDQPLDCLGPLGSGFVPGEAPYFLVAGGIGAAPLLFLAQTLSKQNQPVRFYYGTASEAERVPLHAWLPATVEQIDATEDGSKGFSGRVTAALDRDILQGIRPGQIMACGPEAMLRELARLNATWKIPMQFSLEERMACATGACQGCAVEIAEEAGMINYLRVCREGPVFEAHKVVEFHAKASS